MFMSKAEQKGPKLPGYGDHNNVKSVSASLETRRKSGEVKAATIPAGMVRIKVKCFFLF